MLELEKGASMLRNAEKVFDFCLTDPEMQQIGSLNKNWRYIIPLKTVDGQSVPRDAGHPMYPFNDPY